MLKGVWTALPTNFTDDDRLDEKATASNLEYCISDLKMEGHYCIGNVAEFWSMTNEERMRVHEINVEVAGGRVPLIAGCHHQNPNEVIKLARHAQDVGIDFVIILTPFVAARGDDAIYEFYRYVCERIDIGVVLFNTEATHPIGVPLAKRLADIPNICGFKQGVSKISSTIALRAAIGHQLEVSVADEAPWVFSSSVMGDQWLLNYCPHLYQVPGYLPVNDYSRAVLEGDYNTAIKISRSLNPLRTVLSKWIPGYGGAGGRVPVAPSLRLSKRSRCRTTSRRPGCWKKRGLPKPPGKRLPEQIQFINADSCPKRESAAHHHSREISCRIIVMKRRSMATRQKPTAPNPVIHVPTAALLTCTCTGIRRPSSI
jgi:4-hydroxy-tetrahydrodipicolinate synthase